MARYRKKGQSYRRVTDGKRINTRRKRAKKLTLYQQPTVNIGQGFPKKMVMTHKYNQLFTLTSTASSAVPIKQVFSCNGLYDPDVTGAGHQPMYFDQMTALYDHYVVIGSKIDLKITAVGSSLPTAIVTLWIDDDNTLTNNRIDYFIETGTASRCMVPQNSGSTFSLSKKWSAKKFFGKGVLANTDLQGTIGTNPAEQSSFVISMIAVDQFTTTIVAVEALITYIAVWKELKDVAAS